MPTTVDLRDACSRSADTIDTNECRGVGIVCITIAFSVVLVVGFYQFYSW